MVNETPGKISYRTTVALKFATGVVVRDLPANVVAVGKPYRVIRHL